MQIYVGREGNQQGPYSLEQIQQYLAQGGLQLTDPAWYEGLDQWIVLSEVPGVVVAQPQGPPPLKKIRRPLRKVRRLQNREVYGGFWARFLAVIIDLCLIGPIMGIFSYLEYSTYPEGAWASFSEFLWAEEGVSIDPDSVSGTGAIWAIWVEFVSVLVPSSFSPFILGGLVADAVFNVWFWVTRSATPGKMILGLKIVDANTGEKPSVGQCIGRHFAYILSNVPFFLGYLWVAWDKRKQGFHDRLAGTVVIKAKNKDSFIGEDVPSSWAKKA